MSTQKKNANRPDEAAPRKLAGTATGTWVRGNPLTVMDFCASERSRPARMRVHLAESCEESALPRRHDSLRRRRKMRQPASGQAMARIELAEVAHRCDGERA
jgi:hypothetical protein